MFMFPAETFAWPNSGWEYLTGWVATNTPGDMGHNKCFYACLKKAPVWRMTLKQTLKEKEDDSDPVFGCDQQHPSTIPPMCVADSPLTSAYRRFVVGTTADAEFNFVWMTDGMSIGDKVYDPPTRVALKI